MTQAHDYAREAQREDRRWAAIGALAVIAAIEALVIGGLVLRVQTEAARSNEQAEQLAEIVERGRRQEAGRNARLEQAVDEVERLIADQFAEHDHNVAVKLNDLLAQIAALHDRPVPPPPPPSAAPTSAPQRLDPGPTAPPRPVAPATTTTTRPDQRRCAADPGHPRC